MKTRLKRAVFGSEPEAKTIRWGVAAGLTFVIDPATKSQRLLGLDEREVQPVFAASVARARTLIDVGASDGYYPVTALARNAELRAIGIEVEERFQAEALENLRLNGLAADRLEWFAACAGPEFPLDRFADAAGPVFAKIDVEGAEVAVLNSGSRLLQRADVMVLVEIHSKALEVETVDLLRGAGYAVNVIQKAWWRRILPELRPTDVNHWVYAARHGVTA